MKLIDRLISILMLVILAPIALVTIATLIVNWDRLPEVGETVAGYGVQAVELAFLCGRLVLVIGVAAAIAIGIRYGLRWWHNYNQQRDGSHHLRTYKVVDPVTGQRVKILVNPDLMVTPALAVGNHGVRELGALPAELYAAHAQQRAMVASWQARVPGDDAIVTANGSMYRMGGLGGSAKPRLERPEQLALPESRIVGEEQAAEPMLLGDALRQSNPEQFVLGQNSESGTTAIWQPREHLNLGVFGVSGTGKTKSTGFQTMLLAARHGYHVVVLDPKGGADFGPFAEYVEWQPTDSYTFADQLNALYQVHAERHAIMRQRQVGEWRALGQHAGPEIVVVLEEFGTIREEIAMEKGGARKLEGIDHTVEMMFRWARMTGFHFVVIDQAPEKLHPVVRGGCKLRLAYHLDISSASVLKEYEATALPPVGAFMISRRQYQSWNCDTHLPQLLQRLPPFPHQRLLPPPAEQPTERPNGAPNGTERPSPEVANDRTAPNAPNEGEGSAPIPPLPEPPFDVRSAPKRDLIFWWRDHYPTGSQAEFRTWLADRGGTIAKGYISDTFALWADMQAPKVAENMTLEQLRAAGLPFGFQGSGGTTIGWNDKE